ncbi:MAG: 30S ribosomal protein S7 [Candidatus Magasanikbacteria bacterium CG_4_10_14_0_8_um_filter_32_14]|uniref:Small ribosomal subunit protein uS7 n=2 Tax=Candidatus Magasanikiibacteriota TaxID=1752731 RepID=A0A2M7RAT8_9BACT|nr:MAG: 30S ribosomal protein S7 [Candidatus Magasanikbacteria bacterium CG1_02_32_51]PIY93681.1 MAG: 30S ribosomal protein S7 [Candidatus Magasanikbacteria bacterium CG_4_10_14_0_8_um_filter_32_14]
MRGKRAQKHLLLPDPIYQSELLTKFINFVMTGGKKSAAQAIVYGALDLLNKDKKSDSLKMFEQVVEAVKPQVEVRSRRVGGANYQVPMPVSGNRQSALAFRWIIIAAKARKGASMKVKLAAEFKDIMEGIGGAIKKKEDIHRMADANKAFAHFARFSR